MRKLSSGVEINIKNQKNLQKIKKHRMPKKRGILKTFEMKELLNWRIPRPSMHSQDVRVFIWDFVYYPQNGTWTTVT